MNVVRTVCSVLLLLLLVVHGSIQKSTPASLTYKAAVVEMKPTTHKNESLRTIDSNVQRFVNYIEQASRKGADIILFPELSLTSIYFEYGNRLVRWATFVPPTSENYTPCTNSSIVMGEYLRKLSCAARNNNIYIVINLLEKLKCSGINCPRGGLFYYLTNVVFDRAGTIIARYRKSQLMDEYDYLSVIDPPEYSIFHTDFGVTFGNVICLDLYYEEPALGLTRKLNVTDVLNPSGWFNGMPFLNALQYQVGWAYAEDVNLLVSGYNVIEFGYSGTGVYAGREGIVAGVLSLVEHNEMVVVEVWKKSKKSGPVTPTSQNNYKNKTYFNFIDEDQVNNKTLSFKWNYEKLDAFETKLINKNGFTVHRLSQNEMECEFKVNMTDLRQPVTYRSVIFDDRRKISNVKISGLRICAVVECANETLDSCGHISTPSANFNSIEVTAVYVENGRTLMMPSTVGPNLFPLESSDWTFNEYNEGRHTRASISLLRPSKNVMTFGIYGRNFLADSNRVQSVL